MGQASDPQVSLVRRAGLEPATRDAAGGQEAVAERRGAIATFSPEKVKELGSFARMASYRVQA
jgi:hypothetical protein